MKNNTCGNCENLKISKLMNGAMLLASCSLDGYVVPHEWVGDNVTLWRVPLCCQMDDKVKSSKQAPREDWIKINIKDI